MNTFCIRMELTGKVGRVDAIAAQEATIVYARMLRNVDRKFALRLLSWVREVRQKMNITQEEVDALILDTQNGAEVDDIEVLLQEFQHNRFLFDDTTHDIKVEAGADREQESVSKTSWHPEPEIKPLIDEE